MIKPETEPYTLVKPWLRFVVVLAGAFVSLLSLLGFLGKFNWVLDLCSHFRVQYAASLALLGSGMFLLRYRKTASVFLLIAGLNGALVLPLFIGSRTLKPAGLPTLRVMLLNVNTSTGDPALVKKAVQEADPDILVLEEISARWLRELAWLKASHPHSVTQPREDNFGIGLFSKQPLVEGKIVHIGMNIPTILASIQTTGNTLRIVATHPTPPTSRDYARWRDKQLDQLPGVLGPPWPLILVGDLNVTPWSAHFRKLTRRTGLLDSARGRGLHPTWPNDNWFLRIPIDHILHSPDITVINRRVGWDVASDHFPVIVDIVVPPSAAKASDASAVLEKIDQFAYDGPLFLQHKTLAEFRQLSILKSEKETFSKSPHLDNAKIEFRTLIFEGLEISGIVDKGSFSPISATITDPRWPILHDLSVGSLAARVPAALGQPPRPMKGPVEEFSGETETVKFSVSQGRISKIEFIYYFD